MKNSLLYFSLISASLLWSCRPTPSPAGYQLVWSDEFDYSGLPDSTRWGYDTEGNAWNWGNNELQHYTANRLENVRVENGILSITALKEEMGGKGYTSARLITKGKGDWLYGRFEIKAKLPAGKGTWPALWMMPQQSAYGTWPKSGEIDIMEHVGYDLGRVHGTVHTEAYNHKNGTQKGGNVFVNNVNTQFHVYSADWTENEIRWFVDGNLYFTFTNEKKTYREWPFDQPFFLIFNIAIGGDWGGAQGIDPNLNEAVMEIDYVRVYAPSTPKPVISGTALAKPGQQVTSEFRLNKLKMHNTGYTFSPLIPANQEISLFPNPVSILSLYHLVQDSLATPLG